MSTLALWHQQDIPLGIKIFNKHSETLKVVLKQFQRNLFHMLCSLSRILWDTGVPLGGKGFPFPFITNFLIEVENQQIRVLAKTC